MESQIIPTRVDWRADRTQLQRKVYKILVLADMDRSHITLFLDDEAMKGWKKVFTHKSVDAANNYDGLEFYGDASLGYGFPMYMYDRFGDTLDQKTATLLLNYYMSTDYQALIARSLGLSDYVLYDPAVPGISDKVNEDVFEAFVGWMNLLANKRIANGMGYLYTYNLIRYLFKEVKIDPLRIEKDDVTKLKEIFDKLEWGQPEYSVVPSENPTLGQFKSEVRGSTGRVLGKGYGTYDKSRFRAAKNALENLAKEGITTETADKIKLERTAKTNPVFAHQYARLEKAIQSDSEEAVRRGRVPIKEFRLVNVGSEKTTVGTRFTVAIQVAHAMDDGTLKWVLAKQITGSDNNATKIELMQVYADQRGIPK